MSTTTSLRLLLSTPFNPSSSSSTTTSSAFSSFHCKWVLPKKSSFSSKWAVASMKNPHNMDKGMPSMEDPSGVFGSDEDSGTKIPSQAKSLVEGSSSVMVSEYKPIRDVDYIQELLAIQQQGPRSIGFFGTRNMGFMHQELIEILSYAMVITNNHIYTSGASGTNSAVIRGALRAEKPELLTVILPQSLKKQSSESQELLSKLNHVLPRGVNVICSNQKESVRGLWNLDRALLSYRYYQNYHSPISKVKNVVEKPHNDHLPLLEASRLCNMDIISQVQQIICFAFHDSKLLMETCQEAKNLRKIVTLFYLD